MLHKNCVSQNEKVKVASLSGVASSDVSLQWILYIGSLPLSSAQNSIDFVANDWGLRVEFNIYHVKVCMRQNLLFWKQAFNDFLLLQLMGAFVIFFLQLFFSERSWFHNLMCLPTLALN